VPLDVGGGIGLGESEVLRLLEHLVVVDAVLHFAEHVVGGAVAYSHDLVDDVAGVGGLEGVDDGYAAADAGFVAKFDASFCRVFVLFVEHVDDLLQVFGDQGFVGCDNTFA